MDAFVAELRFSQVKKVAAILHFYVTLAIETILCLLAVEDEIAVFQTVTVMRVIAVYIVFETKSRHLRYRGIELAKLLEKGPVLIIGTAERERVPVVSPPAFGLTEITGTFV